jgi:hypothetical protein
VGLNKRELRRDHRNDGGAQDGSNVLGVGHVSSRRLSDFALQPLRWSSENCEAQSVCKRVLGRVDCDVLTNASPVSAVRPTIRLLSVSGAYSEIPLTIAVAPALIIPGNHRCLVSNECHLGENLSVVVRREKMIANVTNDAGKLRMRVGQRP